MRKCIALAFLAAVAPVQASGKSANYVEVAAEVANAIQAGEDLSKLEVLPELSEDELKELAKLTGCKPTLNPGATKNLVVLVWRCNDPLRQAEATISRSTRMRFQDNGRMFSFAVNPLTEDFAPTSIALAMSDLPSRQSISQAFGKAVRKGKDPTLGGLIPLTDMQRIQLEECADRFVKVYDEFDPILVVWKVKPEPGKGDLSAEVHFDEANRPIGVIIEDSLIRAIDIPLIETF